VSFLCSKFAQTTFRVPSIFIYGGHRVCKLEITLQFYATLSVGNINASVA